jgi:16S rRNA (cytidine1402-2'-O)-methyltransferase
MEEMVIDDKEWYNMSEVNAQVTGAFNQKIKEEKTIGIISEAGCPGVADPGQALVQIAQEKNILVKPLVGPNSILLALMASGMNGQHFQFLGYLPIDIAKERKP